MSNLIFESYTINTFEQILGNITIAATSSIKTANTLTEKAQFAKYDIANASTFLTTVNIGIKAVSVGYNFA